MNIADPEFGPLDPHHDEGEDEDDEDLENGEGGDVGDELHSLLAFGFIFIQ